MSRLGTESAFEVLVHARELEARGKEIIHLEIGEPDFATPGHIVEAAARALRDGWTHYGPPAGLPELREAVAEYEARRLGVPVDPAEIVVTPGGKPILFFTILALVDQDDEVLYPNPGFPIYESMINFVGGRPVPYSLPEGRDFDVDAAEIVDKITDRTRLIILNSPHNPTGGVMSRDSVASLAQALAGHEIFVLSDEIYHRLIYEGEHVSLTQFPGMKEWSIILNGFSKAYAMTGWRVGYAAAPGEIIAAMTKIHQYTMMCASTMGQVAALEALKGEQDCVREMVDDYNRRRKVIVKGLCDIGLSCFEPKGAFYAFPSVRATGMTSEEFAETLLEEEKVAVVPGSAFGVCGEGYVRCSYATSLANIEEALKRMKRFVQRHKKA